MMADQVQAAQMLLSYKRKAITRDQVFGLLTSICEMAPDEVNAAIAYTDKMPVQYLERQERVWFESTKKVKH
jgi:hypothetical protein